MSDAGEFRSIGVVIQDRAEFQALTGAAQNLWRAYKLRLGVAGIAVCYLGELVPRCGADATEDSVRTAEVLLIDAGFLKRSGAVAWLVDGLADERFARAESAATRHGIQTRVASLPPCPLIAEFRARYSAFFVDDAAAGAPLDETPPRGPRSRGRQTSTGTSAPGVPRGVGRIPRDSDIDRGPPAEGSSRGSSEGSQAPVVRPPDKGSERGSPKGSTEAPRRGASLLLSSSDVDLELPARARETGQGARLPRADTTDALVTLRRVLRDFPVVAKWVAASPSRHTVLADVIAKVLGAGADAQTYVSLIGMALSGGFHKAVAPEQAEVNLIDWCNPKRDGTEPPVETRVFRRYLTGEDETEHRRFDRQQKPPTPSTATRPGVIPRV